MNLIEACTVNAQLKLKVVIAQAHLRLRQALRYPCDVALKSLDDALFIYQSSAPILVVAFEIRGFMICNVCDENAPDYTVMRESSRHFEVEMMLLQSAKDLATDKYHSLQIDPNLDTQQVGDFHPAEIALVDQFERIVGLCKSGQWVAPVSEKHWMALKSDAARARREALIESGRNNLSEASSLRIRARQMSDLLEVSNAHHSGRIFGDPSEHPRTMKLFN